MFKKTYKKGFTLVELIVVIAIIGILAAVLIPSITGYIDKAKLSNDKTDVANMNKILATTLGVEIENTQHLEAPDIRAIINEKANGIYDFIPRSASDGYSYWYDTTKQKIVLAKASELGGNTFLTGLFAIGEETGDSIEEFIPGYLFLDKGGTELAVAVSSFRTVTSLNGFANNASKFDTENQNNSLEKIKGLNQDQKNKLYAHFNQFHPSKTLYISDFLTFRSGTGAIEHLVFSDGIVSIPTNTAQGVNVLHDIVIPYTVKYIEAGAFTTVTSNSKIILLTKEKLGFIGDITEVLSASLIQTNPHISSKVKTALNKGLGDEIQVDFVFSDEVQENNANYSLKYKPFTFSVNPHVIDPETDQKIISTSARFDYKENDNGTIYLKVKLFDAEGIVGEKSMTYYSPKNIQMSLNGYTLQFENIASAFGSKNQSKLTYYIKIGNSEEVAIHASEIAGIRYDYFFGTNASFAPIVNIDPNKVFVGTFEEYMALDAAEKAQYDYHPTEENILVGGDVGGESEITYLDRKRIEKYFTKSEKVIGEYFYKDGQLFLREDQRGFNQNITITEERLQASNPGYDIKNTEINILEFHIQKNYTIGLYELLSTLYNPDTDSIDVSIRAVYDGQEVISKRVTFDDVPQTLLKKSLYDGDDIAGQNLTNFQFKYEIDNSFYKIPGVDDISDYIKDAYLEEYYENSSDMTPENVYKIKLRTLGDASKQIDLVYIIRDLDLDISEGKYSLEVSTGYHKNDEGEYEKDNPSIALAIDYIPIELDYTAEDIKYLEINQINNRPINSGNGETSDNPFVFFVGEVIAPTSHTKFTPENGVVTDATSTNFDVTGLNTSEATDTAKFATITYIHNGVVQYAQTKLYYIVVEEQDINTVKINSREYTLGQSLLFFEGEKITLNGSVTTIDYILGGVVVAPISLNAGSLNWDSEANKPYYFNSSDNYKKTYYTNSRLVIDYEIWIDGVKQVINLETSQVDYVFTEGDNGTITIKYITKVFYPNPTSPGNFLVTSDAVYVAEIPYRVVPKRTVEENETTSEVRINYRKYYSGSVFEFSDGEKIVYGSGTYFNHFNAYGTVTTINNYLADFTHDGQTNPVTPYMAFSVSSTEGGPFVPIDIDTYEFEYDGGIVKYLKIVATQFNVVHTYVIPYTVLDDGDDPEATKLIPRLINGIIYTGNRVEFKKDSFLGNNALTQMYYKNKNSTSSFDVFNASSANMKFSFSPDGEFVTGNQLQFTQPVGTEGIIYVEYIVSHLTYQLRFTGEIPFKVIANEPITNEAYISTINGRGVPKSGVFTFYLNETLTIYNYTGIGYNYYPDYFTMVYRANSSNTTLYEHSTSKEKNRVHFTYELLGLDGNYHEIAPDYQFGKTYDQGHKYAQLSGIKNGTFRMTYKDPSSGDIICSATVEYAVKAAAIIYINNRTVLANDVFELYSNELICFSPVIGVYVVYTSKTVQYNGEDITYYNASVQYLSLDEVKYLETMGNFIITIDEVNKKFILTATPTDQEPEIMEVPYDFLPTELDYVEVDRGTDTYKAILDKTFAHLINNRNHKYGSLFEFNNNESLVFTSSSLRLYLEREPNELGIYYTIYPYSTAYDPSYYSIYLYDESNLVPVDGYQFVSRSVIKNYQFVAGTSGKIIFDIKVNNIFYRTEIEFLVKTIEENAQINKVNGITYYDNNATVMIEEGSTIIFSDSSIRYWNGNGYYTATTLTKGTEFSYSIKPTDEEDFIPIVVNPTDSDLNEAMQYFAESGNTGELRITYTLRGITYVATFEYEVFEVNYNPQILQINGRPLQGVSAENPFIFVNGEQLFGKNTSGSYANNSSSIIVYSNRTGRSIKTSFLLPEAKYAYYVIPNNVDIESLTPGPYEYAENEEGNVYIIGGESSYLEYYKITSDYSFTLDDPNYQTGILRVVHTPTGLGALTIDVPYEVTATQSQLFLNKISILSQDEKSESITYNITPETIINVLQGQKIKSNSNTQLLFKFAGETEGTYIYASSTAVQFFLVDGNNNETLFDLTTSTATGSTFTGSVGTTGIIRIKYQLYGVTTSVDIAYQIVAV